MMYNEKDYCNNCKWLRDGSAGEKSLKFGRCGLYGYCLEYTELGYKRLNRCLAEERLQAYIKLAGKE